MHDIPLKREVFDEKAAIPEGFVRVPYIDMRALAEQHDANMKTKAENSTSPLTKDDLGQFACAAENMSIALSYAETAFGFLALLHDDNPNGQNLGFAALCYLCGKGLTGIMEKESETVERLVTHLRKLPQEVAR